MIIRKEVKSLADQKVRNAAVIYGLLIIFLVVGAFILKDAQYIILIFVLISITFLFLASLSRWKFIIDNLMVFFLPITLSISKVVWIAHPISSTVGILSVGAGIYLCATDLVVVYFLFRVSFFSKKNTNSRIILCLYLFSAVLSCFYAYNIEFAIFGVLMLLKGYIIYNWFVSYPSNKIINYFMYGAEAALIFQGMIGVLQYLSAGPIGLSILGENNDALRYRVVDGVISRGAAGTFEHSSNLAIFTIFVLMLVIFNERKKKRKIIMVFFGLIVLYMAGSRTALLVFAISLGYSFWKQRSWIIKKNTAIAITIVFMAAFLVGGIALKRGALDFIINSDLFFQVQNRINHWILALSYIKSNIFFGYGTNNYAAKMTAINSTDFYYLNPVHNNYILNLFEIGAIGAILYILILVAHIINFKNYKSREGYEISALLFLICIVIYNFTGWAFAAPPCIYLLWISLSMLDKKREGRIL